jgi:RNA polymerase sigma-70 factor (ECF subfamily)
LLFFLRLVYGSGTHANLNKILTDRSVNIFIPTYFDGNSFTENYRRSFVYVENLKFDFPMNRIDYITVQMNEKELIDRARAGDFEAFTELINANKDRIYNLALRLSGNQQDAEDIVQETFLKAIDNIGQFRGDAAFGTWLYSIALNQGRSHYSRSRVADLKPIEEYLPRGSRVSEENHSGEALFDWADPHRILEADELRRIIDNVIGELPLKYREAFVLRYIEELPVREVARVIGESEAAAKSRILRARLALRDKLSSIFEERYGKRMS